MELVERIEKDYRDAFKDQYIPCSSPQSLHMDFKMYILSAIDRLWGELYTEESEGENNNQCYTGYLRRIWFRGDPTIDEVGEGQDGEGLTRCIHWSRKEQYIPCLEYSSSRSSSSQQKFDGRK